MSKYEKLVIEKINKRASQGFQKYGVTMEREDLSIGEWLQHLQEELMDGAIYVERLLEVFTEMPEWFIDNLNGPIKYITILERTISHLGLDTLELIKQYQEKMPQYNRRDGE